jgi:zinc/manganese transport system substrate-binding protein
MTPRLVRRLPVMLSATALALLVAGCGSTDEPASPEARESGGTTTEPVQVVASTDVYGSIAETVGGDEVEVTSIIENADADPLEYEATPADGAAISAASLVILNGNGYDDFMSQLVEAAGGVKTVLDVSELSGLQPAAEAAGEEFNEHVWYNLETVQTLAMTLATELGKARPDAAESFVENATEFADEIDELREKLADIAAENDGDRIAVTEPLANYLLAEAGLDNVAPEEFQEAIEEGNDPPARVLQEMLSLFGDDPVKVLILNTQTQSPVTDQVLQAAEAADVPVVRMSETLTTPDYVEWMDGQIEALAQALDG